MFINKTCVRDWIVDMHKLTQYPYGSLIRAQLWPHNLRPATAKGLLLLLLLWPWGEACLWGRPQNVAAEFGSHAYMHPVQWFLLCFIESVVGFSQALLVRNSHILQGNLLYWRFVLPCSDFSCHLVYWKMPYSFQYLPRALTKVILSGCLLKPLFLDSFPYNEFI